MAWADLLVRGKSGHSPCAENAYAVVRVASWPPFRQGTHGLPSEKCRLYPVLGPGAGLALGSRARLGAYMSQKPLAAMFDIPLDGGTRCFSITCT